MKFSFILCLFFVFIVSCSDPILVMVQEFKLPAITTNCHDADGDNTNEIYLESCNIYVKYNGEFFRFPELENGRAVKTDTIHTRDGGFVATDEFFEGLRRDSKFDKMSVVVKGDEITLKYPEYLYPQPINLNRTTKKILTKPLDMEVCELLIDKQDINKICSLEVDIALKDVSSRSTVRGSEFACSFWVTSPGFKDLFIYLEQFESTIHSEKELQRQIAQNNYDGLNNSEELLNDFKIIKGHINESFSRLFLTINTNLISINNNFKDSRPKNICSEEQTKEIVKQIIEKLSDY